MQKIITEINCPELFLSDNDWDSHAPALWLALNNHSKVETVTEFGCGHGSTPKLYEWCKNKSIDFLSYETNIEWGRQFKYVSLIYDYKKIFLLPDEYRQSILFVDNAPAELRKDLIKMHENNADIIVIHDTEEGANYVYEMKDVLSTFKHRLDYRPIGKPSTTIVSNFINVGLWQ